MTSALSCKVRRTAGEVPWTPPFSYECTGGHSVRADRAVVVCPACVHGQVCDGTLRRVGPGSRVAA